jgi:hypothetical protein
LTRLCCVLAMTTLYLVAQGTEVVKQGKRRSAILILDLKTYREWASA